MSRTQPIATVDIALFTLVERELTVLLVQRDKPPFKDVWALPGGFVHPDEDEDTAATARRVVTEKTGAAAFYLEQLYTFSGRTRDPRGWSISVAYYALLEERLLGLEDHEGTKLAPVADLPDLPFDHDRIVSTAVGRLRNKSSYSSLPTYLLPEEFTLAELRAVYQQVMNTELDRTSFRRNLLEQGVIEDTGRQRRGGAHRPAQLYRRRGVLKELNRTL